MDRSREGARQFRIRAVLTVAAATFWLVTACGFSPPSGLTNIAITFAAPEELRMGTKTLTPDVSLDVVEYSVIGKGPETGSGRAKFEITTGGSSYLIESIIRGAWEINVFGYNAAGELLVSGSTEVDLGEEAIVTVEMNLIAGAGDLLVSVVLSESVLPGFTIRGTATAPDGSASDLNIALDSAGDFSATGILDAGLYTVEVLLLDADGNEVSGGIEVAYLLSGRTTTGLIDIAIPILPTGSLTFVLESRLPESALMILEAELPVFAGSLVSARLETAFESGPVERDAVWYVNGVGVGPEEIVGQHLSRRFEAAGLFRIDAVLTRAGAAIASDSTILEVIEPTTYGPLAYVSTMRDNSGRVDGISGARAIGLHPSGAALYVAGYGESSIGYFTIDPNSFRPEFESRIASSSLANVSGLAVSPDGRVLAAASRKESLLTLFVLDGGAPVSSSVFDAGGLTGTSVVGLNAVEFAPDGRHLYALAAGSHQILVFDFDPDELTMVGRFVYESSASGDFSPFAEPIAIDVSADGRWVAVSSKTSDSVSIFARDIDSGDLVESAYFADGAGASEDLNGGGGVVFAPDSESLYAVAYYDDAVVRFAIEPGDQWSVSGSISDGEAGSFGFHYPRSLAITAAGDYLYVASSGDDALSVFSLTELSADGIPTGAAGPTFLDAARNGFGRVVGIDGARALSVSPFGAVYLASSNDSSLATFVVR